MRYPKVADSDWDMYDKQDSNSPMPLDACLAKTIITSDYKRVPGRDVFGHCCIVGAVAGELLDRMPAFLSEAFFPQGSSLIAALHDIGKVSPTFQEKIYRGIDGYTPNSNESLAGVEPSLEKNWGGHAGVSMIAIKALSNTKYIPEILGRHHGVLASAGIYKADGEVFGGTSWQSERELLIARIKKELSLDFPTKISELQFMMISGLTCVADWIGSGTYFDDPEKDWKSLISLAVEAAGFVQPQIIKGLRFSDIFGFEPYNIQHALIKNVSRPGTYILEAPMGIGKTEAALYAAYVMISSGMATGIYFALPTQLTSNKIRERVNEFLDKILVPESPHRQSLLLHGTAWLQNLELGAEGDPGCSWFLSGKRGILAPFATGTIDQALMAVMNVKHGFVRTFGLAGKVVILDEVHTYDSYTGTILDKLVDTLKSLHCTVIILSATLTNDRRRCFLGKDASYNDAYPLVTLSHLGQDAIIEQAVELLDKNTVKIKRCHQRDEAFNEAIVRAEKGQQVLWIENTVDEAQCTFSVLAARSKELQIECGLLHSRFIQSDRQAIEDHWVMRYGKGVNELRRREGRILVGTQVLEQSLDIDADFLVTAICPTDMLLQRVGRLWRHKTSYRTEGSQCETWILTVDYQSALKNPEQTFGSTGKVYSPYVLLRTMEALGDLDKLSLPGDIRSLIESTYRERPEPSELVKHKLTLEKRRQLLQTLALQGISTGVQTLSDESPRTRYSDEDTVEILLLRGLCRDDERNGVIITLLDRSKIFLPRVISSVSKPTQRKLAGVIASQTLKAVEHIAPMPVSRKNVNWLENYCYIGDDEDKSLIRVVFINDDGAIKSLDGRDAAVNYQLSYDSRVGYRAIKH